MVRNLGFFEAEEIFAAMLGEVSGWGALVVLGALIKSYLHCLHRLNGEVQRTSSGLAGTLWSLSGFSMNERLAVQTI